MVQYNGNTWKVKGNYFTGAKMEYNGAKIELLSKLPWYEYVMAVIPFIFNIIFIGGIIGAFIAALSLVFFVIIFRAFKNMLFELFAFLGICAILYLIFEILVILEIIALG